MNTYSTAGYISQADGILLTTLPLTSAHEKKAQSFKIEDEINRAKIELEKRTDGLLVYITDHVEKHNQLNFVVSAADIVQHDKGKHVVENAFRELKTAPPRSGGPQRSRPTCLPRNAQSLMSQLRSTCSDSRCRSPQDLMRP